MHAQCYVEDTGVASFWKPGGVGLIAEFLPDAQRGQAHDCVPLVTKPFRFTSVLFSSVYVRKCTTRKKGWFAYQERRLLS